ncbi:MAG: PD-(D/E)XK nuclease family protein, partial [Clostridia bacterium]|nr:PD-(D/E)XK nuclease family protein [Clostridia bacterium]
FHGQFDYESFYITFKTNTILKPLKPIYITDKKDNEKNENTYYLEGKNFSTQSPKMYCEEGTPPYTILNEIIKKDELWEKENSTEKINPTQFEKDENDNFFKIIRKEYDEVIFSNLFSHYFLQNAEVFVQFCREVLHIDIDKNYIIERESQKNIDLLVQDDKNVIVIENKIKSGINGVRHDIYSGEIQSQLFKYYEYASDLAKENNRNVKCFIFSPNYNKLDISKYKAGNHYCIIKYSEIYNFFIKYANNFDRYFNDFLKALYKHTLDVNNELFEEMRRRFSKKILEKKYTKYNQG